MAIPPGTRLASYDITSLLGSGGMGDVYRAKDLKLRRDVAIKVLPEELALDPERLRRFEQEAPAASALDHPNIVAIHDITSYQDQPVERSRWPHCFVDLTAPAPQHSRDTTR